MSVQDVETGPIRPPSEALSLLIRVTRGCPWNRCGFCYTYRDTRYKPRKKEEIFTDIDSLSAIASDLAKAAGVDRFTPRNRHLLLELFDERDAFLNTPAARRVAFWLYHGGSTVFLQDADALAVKTSVLAEIISRIRSAFPTVSRITAYGRSATLARRTPEDFQVLREAGLDRIHTGFESGSDEVLELVSKGVTAEEQVSAGCRVKEAGIELSEYFIPGLGGKAKSAAHASESAAKLSSIKPDYIRLRTLALVPGMPLYDTWREGYFERLTETGIVEEIRRFISSLDVEGAFLASDHMLNLLENLEGRLNKDKDALDAIADEYLSLPPERKLIFILGRRSGRLRNVSEMQNLPSEVLEGFEKTLNELTGTSSHRDPEEIFFELTQRFI